MCTHAYITMFAIKIPQNIFNQTFKFFSFSHSSTCPYFLLLCFYFLNYSVTSFGTAVLKWLYSEVYCIISSWDHYLNDILGVHKLSESHLAAPLLWSCRFIFFQLCQVPWVVSFSHLHCFEGSIFLPPCFLFSFPFQHVLSIFILGGFFSLSYLII